jgi:hypothetical protein
MVLRKLLSLNLLFGLLMAGAAAGLLTGLYSGLVLLGTGLPSPVNLPGGAHGPLMINGFLGALIALERAAALERGWTYAAPLSFVLATIGMFLGLDGFSAAFLIAGSILLVVLLGWLMYRHPATHHLIMLAGGIALLAGNAGYVSGLPVNEVVAWWVAFPVLTIFGERLELNRIMRPPEKARLVFTVLIFLWLAALAYMHQSRETGWVVSSILLLPVALWLVKYDIARRTIRTQHWSRFSALNMLTAYAWIVVAGVLGASYGLPYAGPVYDAILHLFFVGFVFSMIFAHAAVIIPALTGLTVPWSRYFYLPYVLINVFLAARVLGDLFWIPAWRMAGAWGNVAAIMLFLLGILVGVVSAGRRKTHPPVPWSGS